ncbi:MbnP family protein [Pedobacter alpinus]|uniref:MbnP family protein n=1 Tax=Pedobacter alpinus TaxID=1590643 RepID=A0ABW5TUI2_9SPHI
MKKLFIMAFLAIAMVSCKKEDTAIVGTGTLDFDFENVVNNAPLVLGNQSYTNAQNESFTVSTFKYYVSNIELTHTNGTIYKAPENYFLIDQSQSETFAQQLTNIPAGDYHKISFTIGVDSARNFAGAQTGVLAPEKGMFWTWNSGYIFLKMEGTADASTKSTKALAFHIGGATATTNAIRKVSFNIQNTLRVRTTSAPELHFKVNVAAMFTGTEEISFAQYNTIHGGANALKIANNYAQSMFSLDHVHN